MIKYLLKFFYLSVFFISPLILTGCAPKTNFSDQKVSESSQFLKGGIVEKFPGVPIYPEAKIIESYSSGTNFGASAYTEDSLDKVIDFYSNAFMEFRWENNVTVQSTNNYLFEFKSQEFRGTVIVNPASDNASTAITITASPR